MPPLPKPKQSAAALRSTVQSKARQEHAERPSDAPRTRATAGSKRLEADIARFYMMLGTILRPFSRWYPPVQPISDNLKTFSQDAAEAWVELAEKDPKIKKMLESWTSASTWGNVIGVHFAIFVSSMVPVTSTPTAENPLDLARTFGLSDQDIETAIKLMGINKGGPKASGLSDQDIETAVKLMGVDKGGPGDTVRSDRKPEEAPLPENNSGIVSPEDLGVTNPGSEYDVPQSGGGIK